MIVVAADGLSVAVHEPLTSARYIDPMGAPQEFERLLNKGQAKHRRAAPVRRALERPRMQLGIPGILVLVMAAGIGGFVGVPRMPALRAGEAGAGSFACSNPYVIDGDTLNCGDRRVRLAGIDAPELPGHCRPGRDCAPGDPFASTASLRRLIGSAALECRAEDVDRYGRTVARCSAGGQDLSCGQVKAGYAVRRYGAISC